MAVVGLGGVMETYFGDFAIAGWMDGSQASTWGRVQEDFGTQFPEPEQVIYARYTAEGYEGDAVVVFREGDKIGLVTGGHCSCYGLEGQFEPEYSTPETFAAMLERGYLDKHERQLILDRIERGEQ